MRIIVGLGNPGGRYAWTRHNAGWLALDALAGVWRADEWRREADCLVAAALVGGGAAGAAARLVKPLSFMNRSGAALADWLAAAGMKTAPSDLLVLVDDVHLPLGGLRLRGGGSDGGHNGLADLAAALGGEAYPRLRLGVGECPAGVDLVDWVLGEFFAEDRARVRAMAERAAAAADCWARDGLTAAQSRYNGTTEGCL